MTSVYAKREFALSVSRIITPAFVHVVRRCDAVDACRDLAVAAQRAVDEAKLVLRSPNVPPRRAHGIDTVRRARGVRRLLPAPISSEVVGTRGKTEVMGKGKQRPIAATSFALSDRQF